MNTLDNSGLEKPETEAALTECKIKWPRLNRGTQNIVWPTPKQGWAMEPINQFDFYGLAKKLEKLSSFEGDVSAPNAFFDLVMAHTALRDLLLGHPVPITVCKAVAQDLEKSLRDILDHHFYEIDDQGKKQHKWPTENAEPIHSWRWSNYRHLLERFETVFSAELGEASAYFVPRRGIFSTNALVNNAAESFPTDLLPHIPEKTKTDWQAAGRCLAFNLLSASGFHVARAVEGTVEAYYQLFSGKPGKTLNSWGDYLKALEEIADKNPTPCPSDKTLAELRQMKDDYRNPIMHPRVVLSEPDARMLFNNGESVIMAMACEIKTVRENGVQGALSLVAGAPGP